MFLCNTAEEAEGNSTVRRGGCEVGVGFLPLLVGRNPGLVLKAGLHVLDGVGRLDINRYAVAGQRLDKDLHAARYQHTVTLLVLSSGI